MEQRPLPGLEALPRRRWRRWVAGAVVLLLIACAGLVAQAVLAMNRFELVGSMEAWPRPFSWACKAALLSPIRPTAEEVIEMNQTAGALLPTNLRDRALGDRLLKHYIAAGVDVNAPNLTLPRQATALHYAAMARDAKGVQMLLDNGADSGRRDAEGQTPAELARVLQARNPALNFAEVAALLDASQARP